MSIVDVLEFEWDDDNVAHLVRHGITVDEVEDLFQGLIVRRRGGTDAPDRFRALGRTLAGRHLVIIYQVKISGVVRAITGWPMSVTERKSYESQTHD